MISSTSKRSISKTLHVVIMEFSIYRIQISVQDEMRILLELLKIQNRSGTFRMDNRLFLGNDLTRSRCTPKTIFVFSSGKDCTSPPHNDSSRRSVNAIETFAYAPRPDPRDSDERGSKITAAVLRRRGNDIGSLRKVVNEGPIGTKINDLDLCLEVV